MQLLSTRTGLLYLCSRPEQTNGIIRALTQVNIFNVLHEVVCHSCDWLREYTVLCSPLLYQDYAREENAEDASVHQLGLEIIYRLHALQIIDQLREFQLKGINNEITKTGAL